MRRFTIMGFTEAELGFVLAALFITVAAAAVHERDAGAARIDEQQMAGDSVRAQADAARDSLHAARDSLIGARADLLRLQDSLLVLQGKLSTKVPQCWERGEQSAPIADVRVLGADRYVLDNDTLTIDGIRRRLASFIERGEALDCRFVVRARPMSGIDAVQQSAAVWQLRRYFDVNDRPR